MVLRRRGPLLKAVAGRASFGPCSPAVSRHPGAPTKFPAASFVRDANGQALAYLYSRDNEAEVRQAKVLTKDEARRIAINIAWRQSCSARKISDEEGVDGPLT